MKKTGFLSVLLLAAQSKTSKYRFMATQRGLMTEGSK